jgi:hypothetical protein
MTDRYPKSKGGAWINKERATDKHPHLKGHIVVTPEQIRKLIEMAKAGMEPRLQLAVWKSESDAGVKWLSIATEAYMKEESSKQPAPDFDDGDIPF